MKDALTQARACARLKRIEGDEINWAPQNILQSRFASGEGEERRLGIRFDQQVNIACGRLLATGERPKHARAPDSMLAQYGDEPGTLLIIQLLHRGV